MTTYGELLLFKASCESVGVELPASVARGLELIDIAYAAAEIAPVTLLDLTDEQVLDRITDLAIRSHTGILESDWFGSTIGMSPGIARFVDALLTEVRGATLPHLETMVESLQPSFEELTGPLVTAARDFGFTWQTKSDDVILLADENASQAWRDVRAAIPKLGPIVNFRKTISQVFDVSPTEAETQQRTVWERRPDVPVNWSVCFAADDNWSLDEDYVIEGTKRSHIDWLALAAGGLRLNTPDEVRAKLHARKTGQE